MLPIAPGLPWVSITLLEHHPPRPLKASPQGLSQTSISQLSPPIQHFLCPYKRNLMLIIQTCPVISARLGCLQHTTAVSSHKVISCHHSSLCFLLSLIESCVQYLQLSQSELFLPSSTDEAPDEYHVGIAVVQYHLEMLMLGKSAAWDKG